MNLNNSEKPVRVIENCLNGRRTVWDDPVKQGRNGISGLAEAVEMHSPLLLVILMLGTNDFQSDLEITASQAAEGIGRLVREIRSAPIEPGMPVPGVLVVCPPPIGDPSGEISEKFHGARDRCIGLAEAYEEISLQVGCEYFDSAKVVSSSRIDGVHLDSEQHETLGRALCGPVGRLI